jgi:hypothetical protein
MAELQKTANTPFRIAGGLPEIQTGHLYTGEMKSCTFSGMMSYNLMKVS